MLKFFAVLSNLKKLGVVLTLLVASKNLVSWLKNIIAAVGILNTLLDWLGYSKVGTPPAPAPTPVPQPPIPSPLPTPVPQPLVPEPTPGPVKPIRRLLDKILGVSSKPKTPDEYKTW